MNPPPSPHDRAAIQFCAKLALLLLGLLASLGLLSLGSLWGLPGHRPVQREALMLVLAAALPGLWMGWRESRSVTAFRRVSLLVGLSSFPLWKLCLQQGARPSELLWVVALWIALAAGAEGAHLWRWKGTWQDQQPVLAHPLFPLWTLLGIALGLTLLPYLGVVPCACAMAGQALCWWRWVEAKAVPARWPLRLLGASCVGIGLAVSLFGLHLSQNELWAVDQRRLGGHTFRVERLRKHSLLTVSGPGNPFYSSEAHRWAEALVHPPLAGLRGPARVWLLGGETGLVLRELLRYPHVTSVTVWTPRPARQRFFASHPLLRSFHQGSFRDPRVRLKTFSSSLALAQAIESHRPTRPYTRILQLLDAPWQPGARDFYSAKHFRALQSRLGKGGRLGVGLGLLRPPEQLGCLLRALRRSGWQATPYRAFGLDVTWGFALATRGPFRWRDIRLPAGLRYLSQGRLPLWFHFPRDQRRQLRGCPESLR